MKKLRPKFTEHVCVRVWIQTQGIILLSPAFNCTKDWHVKLDTLSIVPEGRTKTEDASHSNANASQGSKKKSFLASRYIKRLTVTRYRVSYCRKCTRRSCTRAVDEVSALMERPNWRISKRSL